MFFKYSHQLPSKLVRQFTTTSKHFQLPKLSQSLVVTSKAKDSSLFSSHDLMIRAGLIHQSSAGIYSLLPFGLRSLNKIKRIIEEELDAIGCHQLDLPNLSSGQLWKQTNRWNIMKEELIKLKDRKGTDFCLAPTHEEEITNLIGELIHSYRNLPVKVYQIGKKFRDELRPRGGLLRGREFLMKDLYSFDSDVESAMKTYHQVQIAYKNIFNRIGISYKICEADTGSIGGTLSNEFHFLSPIGEDKVLSCLHCGYSANQEAAKGVIPVDTKSLDVAPSDTNVNNLIEKIDHFNNQLSNQAVSNWIRLKDEANTVVCILSKKGHEINWISIETAIQQPYQIITRDEVDNADQVQFIVDTYFKSNDSINLNEQPSKVKYTSIHLAKAGDHCPKCAKSNTEIPLDEFKAIEVGHTFYLGTKYSSQMNSTFSTSQGKLEPFVMGCFGIGVSRLLPAAIECSHDKNGIIWPYAIAPYRLCVVPIVPKGSHLSEFTDVIENIETELKGIESLKGEVILDDRIDLSVGTRLKDCDLIGYPFVIVIGKSYKTEGKIELQVRSTPTEKQLLHISEIKDYLSNQIKCLSY